MKEGLGSMSRSCLACLLFTSALLASDAVAPVPTDPHELVTGGAVVAETPSARAAILGLFERAKQNSDLHMPGTAPFFLRASFNTPAGPGELTETWLSARSWRWTANLGDYSQIRLGSNGRLLDAQPVPISVIPMRVQSLRSAIFWPVGQVSNVVLRTANVEWNGRPVTCILNSRSIDPAVGARQWVEQEYCIDNASGLLQIHSPAPGSFIVYRYAKNLQFHGRVVPDHITAYIAGAAVIDAQVDISDAGAVDSSELAPTKQMLQSGPVVVLNTGQRFPVPAPGPAGSTMILPVMVHVAIGMNGKVTEAEVAAAADPELAQSGLALVRNMTLEPSQIQRETYINVRFMPAAVQ
jgi:hypothetical protein